MTDDIVLDVNGRSPFPLVGAGPWSLGRSEASDLCFPDDPRCSRAQIVIQRTHEGLFLEPISKITPIHINGHLIAKTCLLREGDTIRFAGQVLTLRRAHAMPDKGARARRSEPRNDAAAIPQTSGKIVVFDNQLITRQDPSRGGGAPRSLILDHPTVSRRHARFRVQRQHVSIEDLGSTNGTRVNGRRITRRTDLNPGDIVAIGIFTLAFDGRHVSIRKQGEGVPLSAYAVSKIVHSRDSKTPLKLIDQVSVDVQPGELVCIIGESGSGKSTLMNIISGRKKPSEGLVRLGEFDIHAYFDALKQNMAYVPQSDLLHEALTLRQALNFVAELRLPRDTPATDRNRIVEEAALSVGLDQRLDVKIGLLSGGQKKRASLATEILNRPKLLFLDEVTSGLDESTDREIMALLKRLTQRGMTIVCVTHTLANIEEYADKVIVMAAGGSLTFCGPPRDMLAFFGIRYLGEAFSALDRQGTAYWRGQFERAEHRPAIVPGAADARAAPRHQREPLDQHLRLLWHQFGVLTRRNIALVLGDTRTLAMAAIQSVIVGALLGYAYGDFGSNDLEIANSKLSFLLVLGITCLWIGCAGAAKDIVGELAIYLRERDINLSTVAFVLSKFLVTSVFTVLQVALLMVTCGMLAAAIPGPTMEQFLLAALAGIAGAAVGLFISGISNSRDQAAVVVPLALAPQLIFGSGLVTTLSSAGQWLAKILIGAYWTREAMTGALVSTEAIYKVDPNSGMHIAVTAHSVGHSVVALLAQTAGWIALTIVIMYWRHARKGE